jgi:hypothetical protein
LLPSLRPFENKVNVLDWAGGKTIGIDLSVWLHTFGTVFALDLVVRKRFDQIGRLVRESMQKMFDAGTTTWPRMAIAPFQGSWAQLLAMYRGSYYVFMALRPYKKQGQS